MKKPKTKSDIDVIAQKFYKFMDNDKTPVGYRLTSFERETLAYDLAKLSKLKENRKEIKENINLDKLIESIESFKKSIEFGLEKKEILTYLNTLLTRLKAKQ